MTRARRLLFVVSLCCIVVLSGCATTRRMLIPTLDQSNQVFLERTVKELDIASMVKQVAPVGSTIALVSIEKPATVDLPIVAMIEDGLIEVLDKAGYKVLERDEDLLRRLVAEGSASTYQLVYPPSVPGDPDCPCPEGVVVHDTQLESADYVISYRVLEFGVLYREGSKRSLAKREGVLRAHIRIQDVATGEVKLAERTTAMKTDEVDMRLVQGLADFHYSYYSTDSPLQNPVRTGFVVVPGTETIEATSASAITPMRILMGIGALVALIILL